jgi:hypothetical protein
MSPHMSLMAAHFMETVHMHAGGQVSKLGMGASPRSIPTTKTCVADNPSLYIW